MKKKRAPLFIMARDDLWAKLAAYAADYKKNGRQGICTIDPHYLERIVRRMFALQSLLIGHGRGQHPRTQPTEADWAAVDAYLAEVKADKEAGRIPRGYGTGAYRHKVADRALKATGGTRSPAWVVKHAKPGQMKKRPGA